LADFEFVLAHGVLHHVAASGLGLKILGAFPRATKKTSFLACV
jgi:hypothetical protein